jgi:hypothetical protein
MISSARRIWTCLLLFPVLLSGGKVLGQVKGDSYQNWYSWDATGGFMMPMNIFNSALTGGMKHSFHFSGTPGYIFSLAKPIGLQFIVGADLEDLRMKGDVNNFLSLPSDTLYNIRLRTYSLYFQYYLTPDLNINPFIMAKLGYSGINRASVTKDLSRSLPADRWDWIFTAGAGATWHAGPNVSVNLYGEFSMVPSKYLPELFAELPQTGNKMFPMTRLVLSFTGHTDIRVFYPFRKGKTYRSKYKSHEFLPYNRVRMRK